MLLLRIVLIALAMVVIPIVIILLFKYFFVTGAVMSPMECLADDIFSPLFESVRKLSRGINLKLQKKKNVKNDDDIEISYKEIVELLNNNKQLIKIGNQDVNLNELLLKTVETFNKRISLVEAQIDCAKKEKTENSSVWYQPDFKELDEDFRNGDAFKYIKYKCSEFLLLDGKEKYNTDTVSECDFIGDMTKGKCQNCVYKYYRLQNPKEDFEDIDDDLEYDL